MRKGWELLHSACRLVGSLDYRKLGVSFLVIAAIGACMAAFAAKDDHGSAYESEHSPTNSSNFLPTGRPYAYELDGRLPQYQITDLRLRQGDKEIDAHDPVLTPGERLIVSMTVLPWGRLGDSQRMRLSLRGPGYGPGPGSHESYTFDDADWRPGELVSKQLSHAIPRNDFIGHGYLSLVELPPNGAWADRATMAVLPVFVKPVYRPTPVSMDRVREHFGSGAHQQSLAFRLASGTEIETPVLIRPSRPPKALGIVSTLTWNRSVQQGDPVCRVELYDDEQGLRETGYLLAGKHTGHDRHDRMDSPIEQPPIVYSDEWVDEDTGERYPALHHYAGKLPLQGRLQPNRIRFECLLEDGMFDVSEVVFVFD